MPRDIGLPPRERVPDKIGTIMIRAFDSFYDFFRNGWSPEYCGDIMKTASVSTAHCPCDDDIFLPGIPEEPL